MKSLGRLWSWLAVSAIFLLGGVSGYSLGRIGHMRDLERFLTARPSNSLELRTSMVADHLRLDSDQSRGVRAVLEAHQEELAAIQRTIEPRLVAAREREFDEIRQLLTPSQRLAFDRLLELKQGDSNAIPPAVERRGTR